MSESDWFSDREHVDRSSRVVIYIFLYLFESFGIMNNRKIHPRPSIKKAQPFFLHRPIKWQPNCHVKTIKLDKSLFCYQVDYKISWFLTQSVKLFFLFAYFCSASDTGGQIFLYFVTRLDHFFFLVLGRDIIQVFGA